MSLAFIGHAIPDLQPQQACHSLEIVLYTVMDFTDGDCFDSQLPLLRPQIGNIPDEEQNSCPFIFLKNAYLFYF